MERSEYEKLLASRNAEIAELNTKLTLAQQFGQLLSKAYDALQSYGIDYRKLKTYDMWVHFSEHHDNPSSHPDKVRGLFEFLAKVSNDIDAAIRRKFMRDVSKDN